MVWTFVKEFREPLVESAVSSWVETDDNKPGSELSKASGRGGRHHQRPKCDDVWKKVHTPSTSGMKWESSILVVVYFTRSQI